MIPTKLPCFCRTEDWELKSDEWCGICNGTGWMSDLEPYVIPFRSPLAEQPVYGYTNYTLADYVVPEMNLS